MINILYNETAPEKTAAETIAKSIKSLLQKQPQVVLAVPGGRSVPEIFKLLRNDATVPWEKVHIFMVDERLVPLEHEQSNFRLAKENLISPLVKSGKLPKDNVHPFVYDKEKTGAGLDEYENELKEYEGAYDIVLLSSGEDGHIGALYPKHHSVRDESEFYLIMHDSPKLPKDRMTMSRKLLLKSKVAVLLFFGEAKREAYESFVDWSKDYEQCPARLVKLIDNHYVITDIKLHIQVKE